MRNSIVTIGCLVALTGCGGGDSGSPGAAPETSTAPGTTAPASTAPAGPPVTLAGTVTEHGAGDATSGTLAMELGDSYFGPTYVKGAPGGTVQVNLTNTGKMPHTFTVDAPKVDVVVDAGGTGAATLKLPASGALAFYCKFHKAQGMQGAFYDQPGAKVAASSGDDGGAYGS